MTTKFKILLRTGKLHQLEAAKSALTEAGLPYKVEEERVTGLRIAMTIEAFPALRTWWAILVPDEHLDKAKETISQLPFQYTTKPDVWDCSPSPRGKKILVIGIWLYITFLAAMFLSNLM